MGSTLSVEFLGLHTLVINVKLLEKLGDKEELMP
jgi:hypothetical protein